MATRLPRTRVCYDPEGVLLGNDVTQDTLLSWTVTQTLPLWGLLWSGPRWTMAAQPSATAQTYGGSGQALHPGPAVGSRPGLREHLCASGKSAHVAGLFSMKLKF